MKYKAVVIGTSSGGMNALKTILPSLTESFAMPVIIVQHIGAASESYWIEMLDKLCPLKVKEADEKEKIEKGFIYVAPANYHLMIERDQTFSLSVDERVNYARPAIDILFESAAHAYRNELIGVILTGANHDGALGIKTIKKFGGLTIVQDPKTAESSLMPESAIATGAVDHIYSLKKIKDLLLLLDKPSYIHPL